MPLIIEDGTGVAGADSYNDLEAIAEYATAHGASFVISPADAAEAAARRAAVWLDGVYRCRIGGTKTGGRAQTRLWPRVGVFDTDGLAIDDDEVPAEWRAAHCEASIRELAFPNSLSLDVDPTRLIKRERKKVGPLEKEIEYSEAEAGARKLVTVIEDILAGLFCRSTGSPLFGTVGRA